MGGGMWMRPPDELAEPSGSATSAGIGTAVVDLRLIMKKQGIRLGQEYVYED